MVKKAATKVVKKKPAATKKPAAKKAAPVKKAAAAKRTAAAKKAAPAKKPPAKKATPAKATATATTKLVRGIELVDLAMRKRGDEASPTPADELAKLTLGARPLTPALRRWLEADGEFFTLGEPQSLAEMITSEFGDYLVEGYGPVIALLTEPIVMFEGWGSDSRRFIYLGKPDSHGELPVFTIDTDDGLYLCLNGPLDVWLAQQAGALDEEHVYGSLPKAYEPARTEHSQLNFGGNVQFADDEFTSKPPGAN